MGEGATPMGRGRWAMEQGDGRWADWPANEPWLCVAVGNVSHSDMAVGRGCETRLWLVSRDFENLRQRSRPRPCGRGGCDGCGLTATTAVLHSHVAVGNTGHSHPQPPAAVAVTRTQAFPEILHVVDIG